MKLETRISEEKSQNVNKRVSNTAAVDGGRVSNRSTVYDCCKFTFLSCENLQFSSVMFYRKRAEKKARDMDLALKLS